MKLISSGCPPIFSGSLPSMQLTLNGRFMGDPNIQASCPKFCHSPAGIPPKVTIPRLTCYFCFAEVDVPALRAGIANWPVVAIPACEVVLLWRGTCPVRFSYPA